MFRCIARGIGDLGRIANYFQEAGEHYQLFSGRRRARSQFKGAGEHCQDVIFCVWGAAPPDPRPYVSINVPFNFTTDGHSDLPLLAFGIQFQLDAETHFRKILESMLEYI